MDSPGHPWRTRGFAALAGIVAGGVTLGIGELAEALVGPRTSPFAVVGNTIVDRTPEWLKSFAISTFGANDKLVLQICLGVVLLGLSVLAGLFQLRRPPAGLVLVAVLGGAASAAAMNRPASSPEDLIPSLAGVLLGGTALWLLVRELRTRPAPARGTRASASAGSTADLGRRRFLGLAAAAVGVAVLTAVGSRQLGQTVDDVLAARGRLRLPEPERPAVDPSPRVRLDIPGLTPFTTANDEFYRVDTALEVPVVHPDEWTLRVHGMVERVVDIDFADLLTMPLVERMITLTCVSNEVGGELAGNAVWLGYPLASLLEQARPDADADMVLSTSVDGFTAGTPLAALLDGRDALLAIGMNGEPLPLDHGFPVRMVVPGLYGYVSATKWVVDLEVTRFDRASAYWTDRDWAERAPIKIASRIDVPGSFAELSAGRNVVAGVAWAQRRGISEVEIQVDSGPWQPARLAAEASVDVWRQWSLDWDATPGRHTLRVRATDGDGEPQTDEKASPFPDGASGWHSVVVEVV
ncbi:molybdopterin-dependent oxidoreductase [Phytoactinopolyspora halotolerans]|uniref:Molybdopterin-dependent oxidoreductase n=1 Tax=Phytoactinopolyspora halotolerans TaxID=1981512 RepID=A0A6L9S3A2_9ACTN|nr:molybdopterin-dependent oxidoreductase [Phytoactinopolyspora halotolerans]NED98907.1 molybdopterin-dependent oxidoreductase [Phytoactinopolyspora halotolerans]